MNEEEIKEKLRNDWAKFVETLPKKVSETPKDAVADWWIEKVDEVWTEAFNEGYDCGRSEI